MAAMPQSYVVQLRAWVEGGSSGHERVARQVQITVPAADTVAYGDATNTIPVAILGLQKLEECTPFVDNVPHYVLAAPKPDGSALQSYDLLQATDANRANLAAKFARIDGSNAGVFIGIVRGYP